MVSPEPHSPGLDDSYSRPVVYSSDAESYIERYSVLRGVFSSLFFMRLSF